MSHRLRRIAEPFAVAPPAGARVRTRSWMFWLARRHGGPAGYGARCPLFAGQVVRIVRPVPRVDLFPLLAGALAELGDQLDGAGRAGGQMPRQVLPLRGEREHRPG